MAWAPENYETARYSTPQLRRLSRVHSGGGKHPREWCCMPLIARTRGRLSYPRTSVVALRYPGDVEHDDALLFLPDEIDEQAPVPKRHGPQFGRVPRVVPRAYVWIGCDLPKRCCEPCPGCCRERALLAVGLVVEGNLVGHASTLLRSVPAAQRVRVDLADRDVLSCEHP